ncbi:MAG: site-specific integrase [bacterium]
MAVFSSNLVSTNQPKVLHRVRQAIRTRHDSIRTEQAYVQWRFIVFHHKRYPLELAEPEINAFLSHLAVDKKGAVSTQNQTLSAILFLYKEVLGRPIGALGEVVWAKWTNSAVNKWKCTVIDTKVSIYRH